jgi:multiple sugar transport system permease protein
MTRPKLVRRASGAVYYIAASAVAIAFLFPLYWALSSSIKSNGEANQSPATLFPQSFSWDNYVKLADYGIGIWGYVGNTLTLAGFTVAGTVILGVLAGYGYSKFTFRFKGLLFGAVLVIFMVPYPTIVLPLYLLLDQIGLLDTYFGLSILIVLYQLPFAVFMMRNSFDAVPQELDDAARVDGANAFQAFRLISLRLVTPGIVTIAMFAFLAAWNDLFGPLIFLSDGDKFTLPVMLVNVRSGAFGTVDFGLLHAGLVVSVLPVALLFLALQRFYVGGLIAGAVKS